MVSHNKVSDDVAGVVQHHFRDAGGPGSFTVDDYLHSAGSAADACLYVALFCPHLVEVDGSVLLRRSVETEAERARFLTHKAEKGRRAAEASFNFVEVPYLFGPKGRDLSDEEDLILAQAIATSWRAWLGYQYPGREFEVQVLPPEETGSVVGIHFRERSSK